MTKLCTTTKWILPGYLRKKYGVANFRYLKNGNTQQCNIFRHNIFYTVLILDTLYIYCGMIILFYGNYRLIGQADSAVIYLTNQRGYDITINDKALKMLHPRLHITHHFAYGFSDWSNKWQTNPFDQSAGSPLTKLTSMLTSFASSFSNVAANDLKVYISRPFCVSA